MLMLLYHLHMQSCSSCPVILWYRYLLCYSLVYTSITIREQCDMLVHDKRDKQRESAACIQPSPALRWTCTNQWFNILNSRLQLIFWLQWILAVDTGASSTQCYQHGGLANMQCHDVLHTAKCTCHCKQQMQGLCLAVRSCSKLHTFDVSIAFRDFTHSDMLGGTMQHEP